MDEFPVNERIDRHKMPLDRRKSVSTAADGEQGDTCRICRGEGTFDQPLFYPCKCSGSIKYVHQDCLMEWLSHSQKKYCELCKTPFRFTKLYDESMPTTLPLPLFLRQVGVHALRTLGRWLRYVFVTFIWTCCLPWSIRQIWRGLFWLADGSWMSAQELKQMSSPEIASTLVDNPLTRSKDPQNQTSSSYLDPVGDLFNLLTGAPLLKGLLRLLTTKSAPIHASSTSVNVTGLRPSSLPSLMRQPSLLSNVTSLNSLTKSPLVNNGLIDILEGQLICLSVIAAFILVFLIREWVINQQPILNMPNPDQQNAQPIAAPQNEDARQPGRRRRRGFRRPQDRDEQLEDQGLDRPVANLRARHAALDRPILGPEPPEQTIEQEIASPQLNPPSRSTSIQNILEMETVEGSSWHLHDLGGRDDLESPPLHRGIFDEVGGIRRNIEERTSTSAGPSGDHPSDHATNTFLESGNGIFAPQDTKRDEVVSNGVRDTNSIFGQSIFASDAHRELNGTSAIPSSFEREDTSTAKIDTQDADPDTIQFRDSNSHWGALEIHKEPSDDDSSNEPGQDLDTPISDHDSTMTEIANQEQQEDEPEPQTTDDDIEPDTLAGRIAQWMWYTDESIRTEDQNNGQGEAANAHDAREQGLALPAGNINPINPAQPAANVPPQEQNLQFGIDLNDPNAIDDAEDLEGILELIGMEGPFAGMIQNIIFSVFLITLTLSASVWCPYIWGKIAILIMSNPIGVFFKAPLFFVSKCGNILVDLMLFIGGLIGFGLSNVTKLIRIIITPALPRMAAQIKVATVENWAYGISQSSGIRLERALSGTFFGLRPDLPTFSMQSHHALRVFRRAAVDASSAVSADILETFKDGTDMWQSHGIVGIPLFLVNETVHFPKASWSALKRTYQWWCILQDDLRMRPLSQMLENGLSLAEWTTEDKVLAILVGYAFFAAAGFAYLRIAHIVLGLRKDEKVDGMFADSLRQAGGVLKVIIIIGIEMIVFPLYCGLLLDCALLPLFRGATFQTRLVFLINAPVTCLFIHWFAGTCYMFHFALFVSMCRKILRKGVLYFIRDPDDPTFHPVRDVLERPVATQLGKIAFSALVYGGLVIICLGGVVWTMSTMSTILPVRWSTSEPRLAFPVDIIFYNFMLPLILRRAELPKKIAHIYRWWFRRCAKALRLSHFLFGEEREEEKHKSRFFWQPNHDVDVDIAAAPEDAKGNTTSIVSNKSLHDGRYVRVPAADSVRIPKGTKVFVDVDENNRRIDNQPDRDLGMHGRNDVRFAKIYIPSHFRTRISLFVFLVWLFSASAGVAFTVFPLLTGRHLIRLVALTSTPNDLYAFTVGVHICGAISFIGYIIVTRKDKLRSKASDVLTNTKEFLPRLYKIIKHTLGLVYVFTTVLVILPFVVSLITELYIHMPIYNYFATTMSVPLSETTSSNSTVNPTIFILQTWTLGLLYFRLAIRMATSYPTGQNRPSTALRAIIRDGYFRPDVKLASRALIFPALTICIILLAAPLGLAKIVITLTGTVNPDDKLQLYRHSYPFLLGTAVSAYTAVGLQHKIEGWRIKVRDEVYLVGERLHNFSEPDSKKKSKASGVTVDKGKGNVTNSTNDNVGEGGRSYQVIDGQANSVGTKGYEIKDSENAVASGSSTA